MGYFFYEKKYHFFAYRILISNVRGGNASSLHVQNKDPQGAINFAVDQILVCVRSGTAKAREEGLHFQWSSF